MYEFSNKLPIDGGRSCIFFYAFLKNVLTNIYSSKATVCILTKCPIFYDSIINIIFVAAIKDI